MAVQAEKDTSQAAALEAARQRAIAAAEGRSVEMPPKASEKEKPVEIQVTLPELPKVSIQVSEDESRDEEDDMSPAKGHDDDIDDEDDADDYIPGADEFAPHGDYHESDDYEFDDELDDDRPDFDEFDDLADFDEEDEI